VVPEAPASWEGSGVLTRFSKHQDGRGVRGPVDKSSLRAVLEDPSSSPLYEAVMYDHIRLIREQCEA
jgi:hypothetical protein